MVVGSSSVEAEISTLLPIHLTKLISRRRLKMQIKHCWFRKFFKVLGKKKTMGQKDPHPSKNSFPGCFTKRTFVRTPCFAEKVPGDKVYSITPTFQPNKN